jgi:ATP-dependent Clp protease ATP-binding subunit ClpA
MSLMSQHPPDIRHVVVHAARAEARADGSCVVEAEHVLLALADQEGTTAQRLLISAGLGRHSLRTALDREREASLRAGGVSAGTRGLPMSSAGPHRSPPLGASVKRLLLRGHSAAKAHGGGRISSTHLLLGILGAHVGTVPRALALAGVDQAGLATGADRAVAAGD